MRRRLATIYAIFCLALLIAGLSLVFYFAWNAGTNELVKALVSIFLSLILAPTLHELGHIFFAFSCDMELNYAKFFCFQVQRISGRLRFCLASPFAPDETQVVPKRGGDMKKRATFYTLGGLIVQGAFTFLFTCVAVVLACCGIQSFLFCLAAARRQVSFSDPEPTESTDISRSSINFSTSIEPVVCILV